MKRRFIAAMMAAVLTGSLMACGSGAASGKTEPAAENAGAGNEEESQPEETAGEDAAEGVTDMANAEEAADGGGSYEGVTLQVAHNLTDSNADSFEEQFRIFEEKTGCKVEVERLSSDADEMESVLLVRAATGNLPDVWVNSVGAKLEAMSPKENCYDLSGEAWVTERVNKDYLSIVTDADNGMIYGVPSMPSNVAGVFYNKKVYEELNLPIPATWEEFLENCQVIKDTTDKNPVMSQYSNPSGCQILFLSQYYYVRDDEPDFARKYTNREIELHESDAYMRGLTKMYDIWEKGYQNDNPLEISWEDAALAIAEGNSVHIFCRTNIMSTVTTVAPDAVEDIGFFPLPDEDASGLGVGTWMPAAWCISKNSANTEAAVALLEFLTTNEGVDAYCAKTMPTGAFMLNGVELPDTVSTAVKEAQDWASKASTPVMEYYCNIKGSNMATILSMVGTGQYTPKEAIAEIEADNTIDAQQKEIAGW